MPERGLISEWIPAMQADLGRQRRVTTLFYAKRGPNMQADLGRQRRVTTLFYAKRGPNTCSYGVNGRHMRAPGG
jgi:hypothetical protein